MSDDSEVPWTCEVFGITDIRGVVGIQCDVIREVNHNSVDGEKLFR